MKEKEAQYGIRVLAPFYGFTIGAIVTPASSFYEDFKLWAELKSTTTNDKGEAVQICEFADERPSEPDEADDKGSSVHWKVAVKKISEMTSVDEINGFVANDTRTPVIEAAKKRIEELDGETATVQSQS